MAYKILTKDHIVAILMALAPRFVGRDQDHLLGLADEAAWAAYDRAYDAIEPLQEFDQLLQGPAGASVIGITDLGDYYSGTTIEQALEQVGAFIDEGPYIPESDGPFIPESEKAAPNGVATLAGDGRLEPGQLPQLAITDTFEASSEAEMLGLSAEKGDVAVRTDLNQSFILAAEPASTLGNWTLLRSPTDSVTSVFGRVGVVTAQTGDYTWSQISGKPTSFPPSAHTHVWADITNPPVYTSRWPSFSEVTSKPTTLAGYGITDAVATSRTVSAGEGLFGGGSLGSDITIAMGTPDTITPVTTNTTASTSHTHSMSHRYDFADSSVGPDSMPSNAVVVSRWGAAGGTGMPEYGVSITANGSSSRAGQLHFGGATGQVWVRAGGSTWTPFSKLYGENNFWLTPYAISSTYGGLKGPSASDADYALQASSTGSQVFLKGTTLARITQGTTAWNFDATGLSTADDKYVVVGSGTGRSGFTYNGVFFRDGNTVYLRPNGRNNSSGEMTISTAGDVTANDFYATSDARLKTVTGELRNKGNLIPRRFVWNNSGKEDFGFIAQEVQLHYPELVQTSTTEDGTEEYLTVNYAKATAVLAAQVLELKEELAQLKETLQNGR